MPLPDQAPTDPAPTDPAPTDPAPTDAAISYPAPTDAAISWPELRAQATLGTVRRPQPVTGSVAGVDLPQDESAEASILTAAAALGAARRASTRPLHLSDTAGRATAPADDLPVAPPRAGQLLDVILGGEVVAGTDAPTVIERWLQTCADAGYRVSAETLPRLLFRAGDVDAATTARAVGARGRWLAAQNPAWARVARALVEVDVDAARARLEGPADVPDQPDRPATWGHLRRQHRDAAAAALVQLWPAAATGERRAFIESAAEDLGSDDEPWLDAALSDRSAAVARAAAGLLARLPDSRRSQRMADRLRAITEVSRARLRRTLRVDRPDAPSPEDLRDACTERPSQAAAVVDWWQHEIIRGAPVRVWSDLSGSIDPAVRLLQDSSTLLASVADAAALQRDPQWQQPLLAALLDGVGLGGAELDATTAAAARQAERQAQAARTAAIGRLAASLPRPWARATSQALLAWVLAHPHSGQVLTQLRPVMAAGLAADMADVLRGHEGYSGADARVVANGLSRLRHVVTLQHEITEAFRRSDQPR